MLPIKDLIYLYRLKPWGRKLTSFRMLGYTIFGYLMAGSFDFIPIFINTLAVFGVLVSGFLINDYFDFKIQKEENFLADKIKERNLNINEILVYSIIPLFIVFPIIFINRFVEISTIFLLSIIVGLFLIIFYSVPPIRLKKRKLLGFLTTPLAVCFLFLESYSLFKNPDLNIALLIIMIFLFQCYLEILHIIKDYQDTKEIIKVDFKKSMRLVQIFPLISLLASILFSFINRFFIITALFSLIRLREIKNISVENIQKIRSNLFSPALSLYEFGIYGILGILNLF